MILDRAAYRAELRHRTEEWSYLWDGCVALATSAVGWSVRCLFEQSWDMPGLLEIGVAFLTFIMLEGSRVVRGRRNAAYALYRETAEQRDEHAAGLQRIQGRMDELRPLIVLKFEQHTATSFVNLRNTKSVVTMENRGRSDALNVRIQTIHLDGINVTFPFVPGPIPKEGGSSQVVPNIVDTRSSSDQEDCGHDLAMAVDGAFLWGQSEREVATGMTESQQAIPMKVFYQDLNGRSWDSDCTLYVDRDAHVITIRHGVVPSVQTNLPTSENSRQKLVAVAPALDHVAIVVHDASATYPKVYGNVSTAGRFETLRLVVTNRSPTDAVSLTFWLWLHPGDGTEPRRLASCDSLSLERLLQVHDTSPYITGPLNVPPQRSTDMLWLGFLALPRDPIVGKDVILPGVELEVYDNISQRRQMLKLTELFDRR
jgi:hypothetical protein